VDDDIDRDNRRGQTTQNYSANPSLDHGRCIA
jgi:hypothetical protein